MNRIKKGDTVKVIAGNNKGKVAEVESLSGNKVFLKGIKNIERHYRATNLNQGSKRDISLPIDISNVQLVVDSSKGSEKTSKISFIVKDDKKVRVAKLNGKEIK